jgi:hypothetical protein
MKSISLLALSVLFLGGILAPQCRAEEEKALGSVQMAPNAAQGVGRQREKVAPFKRDLSSEMAPAMIELDAQIERPVPRGENNDAGDTLRYVSDATDVELEKLLGQVLGKIVPVNQINRILLPYGTSTLTEDHIKRVLSQAKVIRKEDVSNANRPQKCQVVIITSGDAMFNLNLYECSASAGALITPQSKRYWFEIED